MTGPVLRLFVAFDIPLDRRRELQELIAPLRASLPDARWIKIESQHVTLKFLGGVEEEHVGDVVDVCETVTSHHRDRLLNLGGFGAFPTARRARVLWVGIEDLTGTSPAIARDLNAGFGEIGFAVEERDFTPHLTLARFKTPARLADDWFALEPNSSPFPFGEVVLYRSQLGRGGSTYEAIERFPLGSDS